MCRKSRSDKRRIGRHSPPYGGSLRSAEKRFAFLPHFSQKTLTDLRICDYHGLSYVRDEFDTKEEDVGRRTRWENPRGSRGNLLCKTLHSF